MRYQPAHVAKGSRKRLHLILSAVFAAAIGLVPAVFVATAAHAAAGTVDFDSDLEDTEGAAFTFDLRREGPTSGQPLTLSYTTADVTATAGADYTAISGTTVFNASTRDVIKKFTVYTADDQLDENDESFTLTFTGMDGVTPISVTATAVLDDNDTTPTYGLSVSNPVAESAGNAVITATLSAVSGRDVDVPFSTADGAAVAPDDYTAVPSGHIVIHAGQPSATANIAIIDDPYDEADLEAFTVNGASGSNGEARTGSALSVQIADNDAMPTISTSDPGNITEGGDLVFTVTLSAPSNRTVTATANTADVSATANADYTPVTGYTVTFPAHNQSQTVTVHTLPDTLNELDPETLKLNLTNPVYATAGTMSGTGGITDDDNPPAVTLTPTSVTEGNSGDQVKTFTVGLDAPSGREVKVDYHVGAGTATVGTDYAAVTDGELTFAPGDTSKTFTVTVKGDVVDEPDETFYIVLSNPGATASGGALGSNMITITDDDATPQLDTFPDVQQNEGSAGNTATFHIALTNPSSHAIALDLSSTDHSAVSTGSLPGGSDYDAPTGSVTIPAYAMGADVTVHVNGDGVYEGNEQADITVTTQMSDANVVAGAKTAALKLDNDDQKPTVVLNASGGNEGDDVPVTATVTGVSQDPITIGLTVVGAANSGGSVPADSADFVNSLNATQIPGGNIAAPVPLGLVHLVADQIDEDTQTVRVAMSGMGTVAPVFIAIMDDANDMTPMITTAPAQATENAGPAQVHALLDFSAPNNDALTTEKTIAAHYTTMDGTAKQPGDYTTTTGTVTFVPASVDEVVSVPLYNDSIYEADEAFTVVFSQPSPADAMPTPPVTSTVTIHDDDSGSKPGFHIAAPVTFAEGAVGTATFTVQLDSVTTQPVDFDVAMDDGSAKHGFGTPGNNDYVPPATTVQIPANASSVTIPVTVLDDNVYEPTETATLRVARSSGENDAVGGEQSALLTITDADPMPTVVLSTGQAAEGGPLAVTGTVTGVTQNAIPVTLSAMGASTAGSDPAEAGDFDATLLGAQSIPGGITSNPVSLGSIAVNDDQIDENAETVQVSLAGIAGTAPAWETITDDPMDMTPTIVAGNPAPVAEANGPAMVPVTLNFNLPNNNSTSTEKTLSAHWATMDGTATQPDDYTTSSGTVTFVPTSVSQTVAVPIHDDDIYEITETFSVMLTAPMPAMDATIGTDTSTVTITDDDGANKPSFSVIAPTTPVAEGPAATGTFTVRLNRPTTQRVDFVVAMDDVTAKHDPSTPGNNDYTVPAGTTFIPVGGQQVTIPVTVLDDQVYEPTETATLRVARAGGENDATGSEQPGTLTITDNDPMPAVQLNTSSGTEGDTVQVTATVNGVTQNPIPITLAAVGSTFGSGSVAAQSADFDSTLLTATQIPGGTITGTVPLGSIVLSSDHIDEDNQTVKVTMTGVGTVAPAYITITDDSNDMPPNLTFADATVSEAVGTAAVPVTFGWAQSNDATSTERTVSANYATLPGTATAPADYTAAPGGSNVTFTPGQTTRNASVAIINDDLYETDETFSIKLSSPMPTGVGYTTDDTAQVTITDNDSANKPTFSVDPVSFGEGDSGTANFMVKLNKVTTQPVTFDVTTQDGTAKHGLTSAGGDDYAPVVATVTVQPMQSTVTVPVTVNNDTVYEGDETATLTAALASDETDATGPDATGTLTIEDNDAVPAIALNSTSGTEGSDISVFATITGVAQNALSFTVTTAGDDSDDNNPAEDTDLTDNQSPAAVIPGGTVSGRAVRIDTITLNQDDIDEPVEAFKVTATNTDNLMDPVSSIYKINDDPNDLPPAVSIGDESIGEDEESVDLTVSLEFDGTTTATEQDVVVPWNTVDGTAKAGLDYEAASGTVTIAASETENDINVLIDDDDLFENNQHFTVHLGTPTAPRGATVDDADGDVEIIDDEEPAAPTLTGPATVSGAVAVQLAGQSSEGTAVQLWGAPLATPTAFVLLNTTAANSEGRYGFARTVDRGYVFKTKANTYFSEPLTVRVVQVPVIAGVSSAKGAATLTVTGNPKLAGQAVSIQRFNGGTSWTTVASGKLSSAGTLVATVKTGLTSGKTYAFRAVVAATPAQGILAGTAPFKNVKIK